MRYHVFPNKKGRPYFEFNNLSFLVSELFQRFYGKMGQNTWKLRLRSTKIVALLVYNFMPKYFSKKIENTTDFPEVIYYGIDSTLMFYRDQHKDYRIHQLEDNVEMEFLGYSVNLFNPLELEMNRIAIAEMLAEHWKSLFSGKDVFHGDITASNICVRGAKAHLIDKGIKYSESRGFDILYFYVSSERAIEMRRWGDNKKREALSQLKIIYSLALSDINLSEVIPLVEDIKVDILPFCDYDKYRLNFMKLLLSLK